MDDAENTHPPTHADEMRADAARTGVASTRADEMRANERDRTDVSRGGRFVEWLRAWDGERTVQLVIFLLLAVILTGTVNGGVVARDQTASIKSLSCVVQAQNVSENETLSRLRQYGPTLDAARALFEADTPEQERAAIDKLRSQPVPQPVVNQASPIDGCPKADLPLIPTTTTEGTTP